MAPEQLPWLALGVLVIAFLYSSVGHAGASGYIAVMTLFGLAPAVVKPTALLLNILVAAIGSWQFYRAGHVRWQLFWPFAALGIPAAFLGGAFKLPVPVFHVLVGVVLLLSAVRFLYDPREAPQTHSPNRLTALIVGGMVGLLAGLTGTGGGIFLTPLMILMRWAPTKIASATSVVFILGNSIAGLLGMLTATRSFPPLALVLLVAALIGGSAGSYLGSQRFSPLIIKRLLAAVLIIAGLKLVGLSLPGQAPRAIRSPDGASSTTESVRENRRGGCYRVGRRYFFAAATRKAGLSASNLSR